MHKTEFNKIKMFKGKTLKTLFKTVALITFFSVLTRIAGFLFRIYLSRAIGPEQLGVYQISISIFFVLLTFVASGLPLVISRSTAKYEALKDFKKEKSLIGGSLLISVIASILLIGFMLVFKDVFSLLLTDERCYSILIILLPAVFLTAIFGVFRGWLWGKNNYFAVCFTEFTEQISRIVICFILLSTSIFELSGAFVASLSLTISCVISAIMVIIFFFVSGGKIGRPQKLYSEILKPSTPITTVRIITSFVQPLIAIIIPLRLVAAGFTNSQALSLYGIAIGMTMPLLFIPSAIIGSLSMALIPDLSSAVTKQDNKHIQNRISTSLLFTMFFSTLFVPLFMGAGQQIGEFFYDNLQSGVLLVYSAWFMIPFGITSITSSILNAIGLELKSMRNYILGAILLLLCVWFLPKYIGIYALVWGMGLCMITSGILNLIMIKKHTGEKLHFAKPFWLMCAFILPVTALTSFITNILCNFLTLFFSLAISCTIGALCFILLCMVFNIVDFQTMFINFTKRTKMKFKTGKKRLLPRLTLFKVKKPKKQGAKIVLIKTQS